MYITYVIVGEKFTVPEWEKISGDGTGQNGIKSGWEGGPMVATIDSPSHPNGRDDKVR